MKLSISAFISLDGVVQAPGGAEEDTDGGFAHGGWSMRYFDDVVGGGVGAAMQGATALLYGRRTWRVMADTWPGRAGDPFADLLNAMPTYVVSSTLPPGEGAEWNTTVIPAEGWADAVRSLKADGEGELHVMGSAQLVRGLIAEGLVDDLHLMVEPVLLGGGKSIWPEDGELRGLTLAGSTASPSGVLVTHYTSG